MKTAGHAGGLPLSKIVDNLALEAVFLIHQLGMDVECEICGGNPAMCETSRSARVAPRSKLAKRVGN